MRVAVGGRGEWYDKFIRVDSIENLTMNTNRLFFPSLLAFLLAACVATSPAATPGPSAQEVSATATAPASEAITETTSENPLPDPTVDLGLTLPDGFRASVAVEGLTGPTQHVIGPDGRLWVAQLAGQENAGAGEVVAIDLATGERETLLTGLTKPTGIAVLDGALWIAAGRDILRAPLSENDGENNGVGEPETILSDLPFNGRSEGTLTATDDGMLLYETSGRRQGNGAQPGSGSIWQLDPAEPQNPQPLATGLKGAYARTIDDEGRLWTTEMGDDPVNGEAPPEEINLVVEGADFGWPQCYGDQLPARNYGGTEEICAETRPPVVTFAPHSSPTSIVVSPFTADSDNLELLVALWVGRGVQRVQITESGDNATGTVEPFLDGLTNPQHLLADGDSLLVSDFATGTIYRVERE